MMVFVIAFVAGFLAYANGANDNFEGVATLFESGTTNYRAHNPNSASPLSPSPSPLPLASVSATRRGWRSGRVCLISV